MTFIKARFTFLIICICFSAIAQVDYDKIGEVSSTFLIQNVNVYQPNGTFLEQGSILIKNGRISEIGKTISKPFDAQVIHADSMYAYPAFIDGLSEIGLKKSDDDKSDDDMKFPGKPTDEQAGITPYHSIDFNIKDKAIKDYRSNGFCAAHIVPKGNMIPGQGSIVSFSQDESLDPILKQDYSLFSQFKTKRGRYPSTVIGIIAKWKDLYRKAEFKQKHLQKNAVNPYGERPNISQSEKALFPVLNKQKTVFFLTPKHKDVARAISLQKELGFKLALVDLKQGWMSSSMIKSKNLPVLLSLDLPETKKADDNDKKEDEETKAFNERKAASLQSYLSQAAHFEKANIPFGFTSKSSKPADLHKTLLKMKENGASEKGLINALTTNVAKILGVSDQMGTIEKRKLANIFITDKPYFDKDSKIKYIFVEGNKFEFKRKKKKPKSSGDVDITGKWRFSTEVMGETESGVFIISASGDEYDVQIISDGDQGDPISATDVVRSGNNLSYKFDVDAGPGQTLSIDANLEFTADEYDGNIDIDPLGSFEISGSKVSNPE